MYSKAESSRLKSRFWTSFGQYMSPVLFASGQKLNWINYKSGLKNIYFKMHADTNYGMISIDISHPGELERSAIFKKLTSLKKLFEENLEEKWIWEEQATDINGKIFSRIYKSMPAVNIYDENDWPQLISFFKTRMIKLDGFWHQYKAFIS